MVMQAEPLQGLPKLPALDDSIAAGEVERQLWVRIQAARDEIGAQTLPMYRQLRGCTASSFGCAHERRIWARGLPETYAPSGQLAAY
mmetsp:Transcript_28368/g.86747  ORF Transcript_28368/g.86747 Transcript_28368/m.86747 type:complete len:87 (+) Transcript_28368:233-493(+)